MYDKHHCNYCKGYNSFFAFVNVQLSSAFSVPVLHQHMVLRAFEALYYYYNFFFFLAVPCVLQDLSSPLGIEPRPSAVEAGALTSGPPGNSLRHFSKWDLSHEPW